MLICEDMAHSHKSNGREGNTIESQNSFKLNLGEKILRNRNDFC